MNYITTHSTVVVHMTGTRTEGCGSCTSGIGSHNFRASKATISKMLGAGHEVFERVQFVLCATSRMPCIPFLPTATDEATAPSRNSTDKVRRAPPHAAALDLERTACACKLQPSLGESSS